MVLQALESPLRNDGGVLGDLTTDAGRSTELGNVGVDGAGVVG